MKTTSNLGLKKPDGTDVVDITVLNDNADKLDTEVTKLANTTEAGRMSAADKTKLNGIATGANNYSHPSSHPASIITQDASNRFVTDAEKAAWNAKASTGAATGTANGLMSAADKAKLDGVAAGANNYTHPSSHPASIITQDASNRFVSDAEKAAWNAKASSAAATGTVNGLMSAADKVKLDGVVAGAGTAGSGTDTVIGNRTISDTAAPTGDSGGVTTLLGWMGNMIKAITGKANWRTAPATTLEAAAAHANLTVTAHGATPNAAASSQMARDAAGRAKVVSPAASDDIATKGYVDSATTDGTLTAKGKVQLSNATNSTSEALAATPKAVKAAYDRAEQAFTQASDGKTAVAAAITGMGQSAAGSDTHTQLATKIRQISNDANASAAEVLAGRTYYQGGAKRTGSMPNRGGPTFSPGVASQSIPAGHYSGGIINGDSNLQPGNIKSGKTIFGVSGTVKSVQNYHLLNETNTIGRVVLNGYEIGEESGVLYQYWAFSTGIYKRSLTLDGTYISEVLLCAYPQEVGSSEYVTIRQYSDCLIVVYGISPSIGSTAMVYKVAYNGTLLDSASLPIMPYFYGGGAFASKDLNVVSLYSSYQGSHYLITNRYGTTLANIVMNYSATIAMSMYFTDRLLILFYGVQANYTGFKVVRFAADRASVVEITDGGNIEEYFSGLMQILRRPHY